MRSVRLPGETNDELRARAEQAGKVARILVAACLNNRLVQQLIGEAALTREHCIRSPIVRIEFEQAIAIGGIGETLDATKSKHWGAGPWLMPLELDDEFFPERITYLYRDNSLYNRRFEQHKRLKEILGKHRPLVEHAKNRYVTKSIFLRDLTEEQATAIRKLLGIEPGDFWRACKGKRFLNLPKRLVQLEFFED